MTEYSLGITGNQSLRSNPSPYLWDFQIFSEKLVPHQVDLLSQTVSMILQRTENERIAQSKGFLLREISLNQLFLSRVSGITVVQTTAAIKTSLNC